MKYLLLFLILSGCSPKVTTPAVKVDLQDYVDSAVAKGIVDKYPIIYFNEISVKSLSEEGMRNKFYKQVQLRNLFLISRNSPVAIEIWGDGARNGVIVYKNGTIIKPLTKNVRYIYDGKEITSAQKDTINIDKIQDVIYLNLERLNKDFCFMSSLKL